MFRRHDLRHIALALVALSSALVMAACQQPPPPPPPVPADAWATVDGRHILQADVDKAYRRTRDVSATPADEEVLLAKLGLLDDLVVQDILLAKAAALKVEVPATELDTAEANAKKNMPEGTFEQELTKRGLTASDMREGLRRELVSQKVIAQEVTANVVVTDQEISDFFNANRAQFNVAEESYRIAQIVVTPVRDQQIANGTGDDAASPQAAAEKVKMLMERLKAGASFQELAAGYSEDPESAPRGGDLGLIPMSQLRQAPAPLRNVVIGKEPGAVNVVNAGGASTLVLVAAHEQAGQRDLSTPGLQDTIRDALKGRKEQLLRAAYLTSARNSAKVEHHLARKLVTGKGKLQ